MMSRLLRAVGALALALALTPAWSADADAVKTRFQERFAGVPVDAVNATPYDGLFEVQIGEDLVYTDADVRFVLQGSLVDAESRRNLTRARQEALNAVAFDDLPLALAFTQVRGDGSRQVAVFEDPNCGYCKQFRRTLLDVDDITVHTFMYPMLAPDSADKVRDVWCAKDKAATWDAWMIDGKTPPAASCDAPVQDMLALGQKLRVRGTPTIVFADGTRVSGALPAEAFKQRLDEVGKR